MAKLTLSPITDNDHAVTMNANLDKIEAAIENTLSRDGTSPNTMNADFDLNSNLILNLAPGTAATHPLQKQQIEALITLAQVGTTITLNSLTDVIVPSPTINDVLKFDGANWINGTTPGGIVDGTLLNTVLRWDNSNWVEETSVRISDTGAITAVSYGNILEANLLDKSALELIAGDWQFDGVLTASGDFAIKDGSDFEIFDGTNAVRVLFTTLLGPPDTFQVSGAGQLEHFDVRSFNTSMRLRDGIVLSMEEIAAVPADAAGEGRFWVRNDIPNVPIFTDDTGTDFVLNTTPDPLLLSSGTVGAPPYSFTSDPDTGIYNPGADILASTIGGIEGIRQTEASSHILFDTELHAGLTASTTQTQAGGLQLLSSSNQIATVANNGDAIVLPEARVGRFCEIINDGVNAMKIFPAVGDDLGAGVDQLKILDQNSAIILRGIDSVNWRAVTTEVTHGSYFDEDNTDAFVVSAQDDFHAYHSNGIVVGDEIGWTFDAGGAGTSFPIASVADGAASGVDIEVTTTGSHLLAVGDIISQTNLTSAVYTGIFVVKAIISATQYEVAAVFTATDTGTMDQAATLEASNLAVGVYDVTWSGSMTTTASNETFDFKLFKNDVVIPGSSFRRKFGTGADFGMLGGLTPRFDVANGDKISFTLANTSSAGNVTIRHIVISLTRSQ